MTPSEEIEARMREVSKDLNQFRERRLADRRFNPRASADRRNTTGRLPSAVEAVQQALRSKSLS